MDLKEDSVSYVQQGSHWYYANKAVAMKKLLGARNGETLVDVGSGSGFFARYLLETSKTREAWCVDPNYAETRSDEQSSKPIHFVKDPPEVAADTYLFMDVLEHVEDDVALLKLYLERAGGNSTFLITVPAFEFIWSKHDDYLGHYRRYTLKSLEKCVRKAGLEPIKMSYYFASIFPFAAAARLSERLVSERAAKSDMGNFNPVVSAILGSMCSFERPIFPYNRLFGLTAFCLAKPVYKADA